MILLDTHVWFWFLSDSPDLKQDVKSRIEREPEKVLVSSISVWELLVLARKQRIELSPSPERYVRDALAAYPFQTAWVTDEIAILSETLQFSHNDPADRFIAATAIAHQAKLATEDSRLRSLDWLECL
jgi:PIN domain nuclease of toxin-antitoxin system